MRVVPLQNVADVSRMVRRLRFNVRHIDTVWPLIMLSQCSRVKQVRLN